MVAELGPFGIAGLTVFFAGPLRAPGSDELPVVADHLLRVDRLWRTQISQLRALTAAPDLDGGVIVTRLLTVVPPAAADGCAGSP